MEDSEWACTLDRTIPSSKDEGHKLIEQLVAALNEADWKDRDFFHVQMAAEEAMINAVTHGNKEASDKVVEIEFKVSKNSVFMRFKDQGEWFRPDELPDPTADDILEKDHGRGVYLIRKMMNEVSYNDAGNEVVMIKHRQPEGVVEG